jgi:hypothetical protein
MTEHEEGFPDQWAPVFMDHPDTWRLLLNEHDDIVGYWHFVPLFEEFFSSVKAGNLLDSSITSDNVPHIEIPGWYDIYFVVVAILPAYRGAVATKLLFSSLERVLETLAEQGTYIRSICANAFTPAGISLCKTLNLKFLRTHEERGEVYLADFETVLRSTVFNRNARLQRMYREAWASLEEDGILDDEPDSADRSSGETGGNRSVQSSERVEDWFEGTPFPLASIGRAWLVEPAHDFRAKYDHLLHFFEAAAQFFSVILLSAFSVSPVQFEEHRRKIVAEMTAKNLSFSRATFGTWRLIVEYFGKQTRRLLNSTNSEKDLCEEMFCDPSLLLARALSNKDLVSILASANRMRNDWGGHGGVVSPEEARTRNDLLLAEVQKLRAVFGNCWEEVQLIGATSSKLRRGLFENEITILMGSNSEFLRENRVMNIPLEVECLYICSAQSSNALRLLPLIQIGPSPQSVRNACYFFNRLERGGEARFISYHYLDKPELMGVFDQASAAIRLLSESG